jgi:VWFA-related protein
MSPTRFALLLSLLPIAAPQLTAQQSFLPAFVPGQSSQATPASRQPVTTLHINSREVILDVLVTDSAGNPVKGLKPSDFTITEDGVPQTLSAFSEYDATSSPAPQPGAPLPPNTFAVRPPLPESVTKTVIVLDNIHYPNDPYVRSDILKFIKTLTPGSPIAIIRLDWQGLHLVQDLTSDPQTLQEVVASKRMLPPLPALNVLPWTGCAIPYQGVANPYQRVARFLDGIPGRINLAWITDEGIPDMVLQGHTFEHDYPQLASFVGNQYGTTDSLHLSRVVPYLIKAGGYMGGILQPISDLAPKIELPQIPHVSDPEVQPPAGCDVTPPATGGLLDNGILADKAIELGGHAFFDGATKALNQIVAIGANHYTLSYAPTNPNWNGKYRKIYIKVSGIPQTPPTDFGWNDYGQSNVTYRHGYYARSRPEPASTTAFSQDATASSSPVNKLVSTSAAAASPHAASPIAAAIGFGTLAPAQLNFTVVVTASPQVERSKPGAPLPQGNFLAGKFRAAPYRNYKVHYWIDPQSLKFQRTASGSYRTNLQFVAVAYQDDGFAANSSSASAHIELSATDLESIMTSGVTFDQTIAIPAEGNFFLRTAVQEGSNGRIGALEVSTGQIQLPPAQTASSQ